MHLMIVSALDVLTISARVILEWMDIRWDTCSVVLDGSCHRVLGRDRRRREQVIDLLFFRNGFLIVFE